MVSSSAPSTTAISAQSAWPILTTATLALTYSSPFLFYYFYTRKTNPHPKTLDSLISVLQKHVNSDDLIDAILPLSTSIIEISVLLQNTSDANKKETTSNASGDEQLTLDVKTDEICFSNLRKSRRYTCGISEETPEYVDLTPPPSSTLQPALFTCTFDPLDGSSIIPPNFTIGSIFSIWPAHTKETPLAKMRGTDQVAGVLGLYGSRTQMTVALPIGSSKAGKAIVLDFTFLTETQTWVLSSPEGENAGLKLSNPSKKLYFAPGNLRATQDSKPYANLIDHYLKKSYTLRYSGGFVPDVYHALIKGSGVYTNIGTVKNKAKLRFFYEVACISLVVECAGGEARDDVLGERILDCVVGEDLDRRVGGVWGGKGEVEVFVRIMFEKMR